MNDIGAARSYGLRHSVVLVTAPVWIVASTEGVAIALGGEFLPTWLSFILVSGAGVGSAIGLILVRRMWVKYVLEVLTQGQELANGMIMLDEDDTGTGARPSTDDPLGHIETSILELARSAWSEHEELRRSSELSFFDSKLQRGFELAGNEEEAIDVIGRAIGQVLPRQAAEILLLDGDSARFRASHAVPLADQPGCGVTEASACVAVRNSVAMSFGDSEDLDACPRLRGRTSGQCAACCVPINSMGQGIGVIHLTGHAGWQAGPDERQRLNVVAYQAGIRLGMLQTLANSNEEARIDTLTGLPNRRAFGPEAEAVLRTEGPHIVAMADLDQFKLLNDTHGHEAGDRALVLFGRLAKEAFRRQDLRSRHGGEEFAFLLAKCPPEQATKLLTAFCRDVEAKAKAYGGPAYTVSIGWASSPTNASTLKELLQLADQALYTAKEQGRNRVVGFGDEPTLEQVVPQLVGAS